MTHLPAEVDNLSCVQERRTSHRHSPGPIIWLQLQWQVFWDMSLPALHIWIQIFLLILLGKIAQNLSDWMETTIYQQFAIDSQSVLRIFDLAILTHSSEAWQYA